MKQDKTAPVLRVGPGGEFRREVDNGVKFNVPGSDVGTGMW